MSINFRKMFLPLGKLPINVIGVYNISIVNLEDVYNNFLLVKVVAFRRMLWISKSDLAVSFTERSSAAMTWNCSSQYGDRHLTWHPWLYTLSMTKRAYRSACNHTKLQNVCWNQCFTRAALQLHCHSSIPSWFRIVAWLLFDQEAWWSQGSRSAVLVARVTAVFFEQVFTENSYQNC